MWYFSFFLWLCCHIFGDPQILGDRWSDFLSVLNKSPHPLPWPEQEVRKMWLRVLFLGDLVGNRQDTHHPCQMPECEGLYFEAPVANTRSINSPSQFVQSIRRKIPFYSWLWFPVWGLRLATVAFNQFCVMPYFSQMPSLISSNQVTLRAPVWWQHYGHSLII